MLCAERDAVNGTTYISVCMIRALVFEQTHFC